MVWPGRKIADVGRPDTDEYLAVPGFSGIEARVEQDSVAVVPNRPGVGGAGQRSPETAVGGHRYGQCAATDVCGAIDTSPILEFEAARSGAVACHRPDLGIETLRFPGFTVLAETDNCPLSGQVRLNIAPVLLLHEEVAYPVIGQV